MESAEKILSIVIWPAVVLAIVVIFRAQLAAILTRVTKIQANSKGVELLIANLEKQGQLPFGARTELSGLTSHDIWALFDLGNKKLLIKNMNLPQKVASRTLLDAGLFEIQGDRKSV